MCAFNIHYLLSHLCFHCHLWGEKNKVCERKRERKDKVYQVYQHNCILSFSYNVARQKKHRNKPNLFPQIKKKRKYLCNQSNQFSISPFQNRNQMRNVPNIIICMQFKASQRMFRIQKVTMNLMRFSFTGNLQKCILISIRSFRKEAVQRSDF